MSLKARALLAAAVLLVVGVLGVVGFVVALQGLERATSTQRSYAALLADVSSMRDLIFEYVADGKPDAAARVADQAAYVRGRIDSIDLPVSDARSTADLARVESELREIESGARQLSLGAKEPLGSASRAELERGVYARATDIAAAVIAMQERSNAQTNDSLGSVRTAGQLAALFAALLASGAVAAVGLRIARGLDLLGRGLGAYAAGDRAVRVDVGGHDEITQVAARFNEMATLVEDRERELAFTNERLLAADRAKSGFIANMSHDLRTPLNSIIGFSGVMLGGMTGPLSDEQQRQVEFINRSGKHLKTLVDDVLDLARMDSIGWEPHPRRFALEPLVRDVIDTVLASARSKGLEVIEGVEPPDAWVIADEVGVRRILTNLAGNAVKFTREGSVGVYARVTADALVLTVTDTGPGIAPEDRDRIFEPFEQAGVDPAVAKEEGSGLGLAITRRIVSVLDGEMDLESRVGHGSTFVVTLPVAVSRRFRDGDTG
ncbi:MAG: HAMP domain-containing sensor histidine kinase [Coriobacteriia bacterium]|nr:HAMP domain-containing sensor histidine kinase [Coriobacteriia bacterium]